MSSPIIYLRYLYAISQIIIAIYLMIPLLSLMLYSIMKLFSKPPIERFKKIINRNHEFGIIITAHQEIKFIDPLVDSILNQQYKYFYIYIVIDDCQTIIPTYENPRIVILSPTPALHSKIKSIDYAINNLKNTLDAIIIFDADNIIHPSFLDYINQYFQKGFEVVQANFKPKNIDSDYARMDAIGDMFNFFIERQSRMWLGLSSAIWGSGIAIKLSLYKEIKYKYYLGGFDKKMQSHLVKRVNKIAFAEEAILFDEKITTGQSLQNQRTRWISSYFKYFKESFSIFQYGIQKINFNLIYFGFVTMRPPLFIVFTLALLFGILNIFIFPGIVLAWPIIVLTFIVTFITIIIIKGRDVRYILTIFKLPLFIFQQFLSLLKIKKAKKRFLKTEHTKIVYIKDILK